MHSLLHLSYSLKRRFAADARVVVTIDSTLSSSLLQLSLAAEKAAVALALSWYVQSSSKSSSLTESVSELKVFSTAVLLVCQRVLSSLT